MRTSYRLIAFAWIALHSATTWAQSYPTRPIQMIVPLQAGSAVDAMMRVVAQRMSETLGQQIVIENQPGAAGLIGAERLARAKPDGYTIGGLNDGLLVILPSLRTKLAYDPLKSFDPVGRVANIGWVLIAHPSLPIRTAKDLIALAKARPGEVNYASGGNGSPQHVAMELFQSKSGAKLTHVPYKGATGAALDVVGGQVPAMFTAISIVQAHIQSGRVRAVAVGSTRRSDVLPDVPTVAESGVSGFEFFTWGGLALPTGAPAEIVAKLHGELARAMGTTQVRERLASQALDPVGSTPDEMMKVTRAQLAAMTALVKQAGIKLD